MGLLLHAQPALALAGRPAAAQLPVALAPAGLGLLLHSWLRVWHQLGGLLLCSSLWHWLGGLLLHSRLWHRLGGLLLRGSLWHWLGGLLLRGSLWLWRSDLRLHVQLALAPSLPACCCATNSSFAVGSGSTVG